MSSDSNSFNKLKKSARSAGKLQPQCRFAVVGDFATQHLSTAICGEAYDEGMIVSVFDADYNQMEAQILDEHSELYSFDPQMVILAMCVEMLYERFLRCSLESRISFAETEFQKIKEFWTLFQQKSRAKILQFTFAELDDAVWGNYALRGKTSFLYQVRWLNRLLEESAAEETGISLLNINSILVRFGLDRFKDDKLYYLAKMPFSLEALPEIARQVLKIYAAGAGKMKKCVVVDLDNTLWGGVIGDDGIEGIQIGELGTGHAFTDLQCWLKELKNRGVLLAVCSKNNEEMARLPFEQHPEMVLRLEDFAMFVANWEDKAANIRTIRDTLNIGLDSMVFLDDNPFERNLVRTLLPEVLVPELPEDPALYLKYLKEENIFETASYSEEDRDRTRKYQEEARREELKGQAASFEEYLQELGMTAEAKPFEKFYYARIAQLTQRSNQFNLRTVRYSEEEICKIAEDKRYIPLYFTLKDKLGDYGLIGVVILERENKEQAFINTWLMSCRVLKRGMEEFMIDKVIEMARREGICRVIGEYLPTAKNKMVEDLYVRMGFQQLEDGKFLAITEKFKPHKTYIAEVNI